MHVFYIKNDNLDLIKSNLLDIRSKCSVYGEISVIVEGHSLALIQGNPSYIFIYFWYNLYIFYLLSNLIYINKS